MNKLQYLAELDRLLIFMTSADRERTLERIGALFDAAGPAGEDDLLAKLGSPTRETIRLSRIYDAINGYEDEFLDSLEASAGHPAPKPKPAPVDPLAKLERDLPNFDLGDLPDLRDLPDEPPAPEVPAADAAPVPEPPAEEPSDDLAFPAPDRDTYPDEPAAPSPEGPAEKSAPAPEAAVPSDGPADTVDVPAEDVMEEPEPDEALTPGEPEEYIERAIPLWAGVPLFILTLLVLALPLAGVCLVLLPLLLLPGFCLIIGAWLFFVGALWCISYIADAAIMFGVALVSLAAGLVVFWLGLWMDVLLVRLYIRAMRGLTHLTLGKKVTAHA